jgi:uncharacterized protein YndB with AHSA1/START domain
MILSERVTIRTSPDAVFRFFETMDQNYLHWHPDHVLFRWENEPGLREGARFYFEERIAGELLKKRVRFTRVEPDRVIEFAPVSFFFRLFLPRITFRITPENGTCLVVQEIQIRVGPIGAALNRRQFDAVRRHMREEGENMKRLLEAA